MTKHTNPFYTIREAIAVLKNLGTKPTENPFRYDESQIHWPDDILSVKTVRVYDEEKPSNHHFEVEIHIDREGFNALVQLTGLNVMREPHSEGFDQLTIHPGSLLTVFTLEPKEPKAPKNTNTEEPK